MVRVLLLSLVLAGCAGTYSASKLDEMNKSIQNCILIGGHPRLGPDSTIICERVVI